MLISLFRTFKGGRNISDEQFERWRTKAESIAAKPENYPLEPWPKEENDRWLAALREDFDELKSLLDMQYIE